MRSNSHVDRPASWFCAVPQRTRTMSSDPNCPMALLSEPSPPDRSTLPLEEQIVRLQALLEASRLVHSTIDLGRVLHEAVRIAVLELEMDGAFFTEPRISFGQLPDSDVEPQEPFPTFPLLARDGTLLSELVVVPPDGRELSLYETDFLEGLVLQTALAAENAANHKRLIEYARVSQDLDAARAIQQSLIPQTMPLVPGYSLAARSSACYQVGGDYLDIVTEPSGSHLIVVADVAGKGLASALVSTAFRSAFRVLAHQFPPLEELAASLSQQHWEEGPEARRRYVTAVFVRFDPITGDLEFVNAGHNPPFLFPSDGAAATVIEASGTPLGLLPGSTYTVQRASFPPGARLLLYTDGLTEFFEGDEEFGSDRLIESFCAAKPSSAEAALDSIWNSLKKFTSNAPQQDDMTAIALCRLTSTSQEKA